MSAITALSEDFEGTAGAAMTSGNTSATQITGSGTALFDGADPKQGSTCAKFTGTANQVNMRWDFTPVTTFWDDIYIKTPAAGPSATTTILQWLASDLTTVVGVVRLNTDMTVQLKDGGTNVGSALGPLPTSTWVRFSVKAIPGSATGHRLEVYTSSGGNAVTPDYDSGNQACTNAGAANVASWRIGVLTNATLTLFMDRNRADNATEPAGLTTGLPPTVNAGPDLTKEVGSGAFTITATATASAGASIVSRSWTYLSGVTGVITSGATTDTVTITAPTSTTGTTVVRYTATDNTGQSSTDDVTLTWVAVGQTLLPVADVSVGSWTTFSGGTSNLYTGVDDTVLDTTDGIASPQLTATPAPYRLRLSAITAPTNTTGWFLRLNKRDSTDLASISITVKLYEADGTTLRKTWTAITTLNTTDTEYQLTLTSGEVAAITSWASGLIVEISETGA